jgi:LAS superfamily LD-carboxypeptidase LdcB
MAILSSEQLTGRVRTHVIELLEPRCTLHPHAAQAYLKLRAAARDIGIDLYPASTFRDFHRQLTIWNEKFSGLRPLLDTQGLPVNRATLSDEQAVRTILIWSALPGASRHHWGTEIDVYDRASLAPGQHPALVSQEYGSQGVFAKLAAWLPQHCAEFGFFLPYDIDRGGVQPEPWHLSYAPVAARAADQLTVEVLAQVLDDVELGGAQVVKHQLSEIHRRYVATIAQPAPPALAYVPLNPAATPS